MSSKIKFLTTVLLAFTMWSCEKYDLDGFQGNKPPLLVITPAPVEGAVRFGEVEMGESVEKEFTITNEGDKDLVIKEIVIKGEGAEDFIVKTINKTIPKGGKYKFKVTFNPKRLREMPQGAKLTIKANTAQGVHSLNLVGYAYGGNIELKLLSSVEYDLGQLWGGEVVTHNIKLKNTGNLAAYVSSAILDKDGSSDITIDKKLKLPLLIKPGETKSIPVKYKAVTDGVVNQTLKIISDGGDFEIYMQGQGKVLFMAGGIGSEGSMPAIWAGGEEVTRGTNQPIYGLFSDITIEDKKIYAIGSANNYDTGEKFSIYYHDGTSEVGDFKERNSRIQRYNSMTYILGGSEGWYPYAPSSSGEVSIRKGSLAKKIILREDGVKKKLDAPDSVEGYTEYASKPTAFFSKGGNIYVAGEVLYLGKKVPNEDKYYDKYKYILKNVLWINGKPIEIEQSISKMFSGTGTTVYAQRYNGVYILNTDGSMQMYREIEVGYIRRRITAVHAEGDDTYFLKELMVKTGKHSYTTSGYEIIHNDKVVGKLKARISEKRIYWNKISGFGENIYLVGTPSSSNLSSGNYEIYIWQNGKISKIEGTSSNLGGGAIINSIFVVH